MKIFISWSGETSRRLALSIKNNILNYPGITTFISSEDINSGTLWFNKVTASLNEMNEALVVLTPSSYARPWLNFEAGYIFGKLNKLSIIVISQDEAFAVSGPFSPFQVRNGRSRTDIIKLLSDITKDKGESIEKWVDIHFKKWKEEVENIFANESALDKNISKLYNLFNLNSAKITDNKVYSSIVNKYLAETTFTISELETKFEILAENYPYYILDLQKKLKVKTKSIALRNHFEIFWNTPLGGEIRESVSEMSQRIFVYHAEQELENDFYTLMLHAKEYSIFILSYENLKNYHPAFVKDFAIISSNEKKVYAEYNLFSEVKTIKFITNDAITKQHEDEFDEIANKAIPFNSENNMAGIEEIKRQVFGNLTDKIRLSMSNYDRKTIEMSKYIKIHDYDIHEEEHAYYIEMLELMISKIDTSKPIRILELGAGTGLLTKRLEKLPNTNIVAIEYDWACFKRLQHNFSHSSNIELHHEDSRIFNPAGKFDVVISSFSDHHIKPKDKFLYFRNVINNMKEEALFIVGDEFIRSYSESDKDDYILALTEYHHHIISIAEEKGQTILASLERESLRSGIEELGDFKVSTEVYEKYLKQVRFKFTKELIGPKEILNIGGVYVYTIKK